MNLFSLKTKTVTSPLARQTSWHRLGNDPRVDWIFILFIGIACAAIMIVIGVTTYFEVGGELSNTGGSVVTRPKPIIDVKVLSDMVVSFDARANEHAAIIKGASIVPDPSL